MTWPAPRAPSWTTRLLGALAALVAIYVVALVLTAMVAPYLPIIIATIVAVLISRWWLRNHYL